MVFRSLRKIVSNGGFDLRTEMFIKSIRALLSLKTKPVFVCCAEAERLVRPGILPRYF